MATMFVAVLLAFVAAVSAQSTTSTSTSEVFGGATSITNYISSTGSPSGAIAKDKLSLTYASVGSSAGINGYLSGQYCVGTSDNPLTSSQYASALSKYGSKNIVFTLPLLFSSYSILTKKKSGLKLTANQVAAIYLGKITQWSAIDSSISGTIVPVARSDGSGTTGVITYWLASTTINGPTGWSYIGNGPLNAVGLTLNPSATFAMGTGGVVAAIANNVNAIGYAQTGYGVAAGLYEAALQNPAKKYLTAEGANLQQSLSVTLPNPFKTWANVHLINQPGAATYPVTSFEYAFFRKKYGIPGTFCKGQSKYVRLLAKYILSNPGQTLATAFYFEKLPGSFGGKYIRNYILKVAG